MPEAFVTTSWRVVINARRDCENGFAFVGNADEILDLVAAMDPLLDSIFEWKKSRPTGRKVVDYRSVFFAISFSKPEISSKLASVRRCAD
jgi:hypothetical protein